MFWLGLVPTVAFLPAVTLAMLACALPFALWGRVQLSWPQGVFVAFFLYACLGLAWTPDFYNGLYRLLGLSVFGLGLILGSSLCTRHIYFGIVMGLCLSSLVAVAQSVGFSWLWQYSTTPSGLFYNPMVHGELIALGILISWTQGFWLAIPILAPALLLAQSRGAWAALAIGLLTCFRHRLVILIAVLASAVLFTWNMSQGDNERVFIWQIAWSLLTPFGHGPGSFLSVYYQAPWGLTQPDFVHNDFLQLVFEFGVGAVPFLGLLLFPLFERPEPILTALLFMALFSFPLFTPMTSFIWALALGSHMRTK